jgi:hypothetical protein
VKLQVGGGRVVMDGVRYPGGRLAPLAISGGKLGH